MNYAAEQFQYVLDGGSYPHEEFYRLKVSGNRASKHVNITPEQLQKIIDILKGE